MNIQQDLPICTSDWHVLTARLTWPDENAMHVKQGLACAFFCLQDDGPGSVDVDVIPLKEQTWNTLHLNRESF